MKMSLIADGLIWRSTITSKSIIMKDPILKLFGQTVAKNRQKQKYSQEILAERASLNRTYISDIERGARNPGIRNVVVIANALNLSAAQLLEEANL